MDTICPLKAGLILLPILLVFMLARFFEAPTEAQNAKSISRMEVQQSYN